MPSSSAGSAAIARIVLLTNHADVGIVPVLRAELETLGMQVDIEDRGPTEILPRDLSAAAQRHHAVAAVRVVVATGLIEVWIADRVTGKVVLRDVVRSSGGKVDETLVAVRAVELLRGSLMEMDDPHPSRGEVAPPPALRTLVLAQPERERFVLGVTGGALWSEGGASLTPVLAASLGWRVWRWIGCRTDGGTSLSPATLSAAEGTAALTLRWIRLEAVATVPPSASPWRGSVGIGLGLHALSMEGRPVEPYSGTERTFWSLTPTLRASVGYVLAGPVQVVWNTWAASMLHHARVEFVQREVGRYGAWLVASALGMEVAWP